MVFVIIMQPVYVVVFVELYIYLSHVYLNNVGLIADFTIDLTFYLTYLTADFYLQFFNVCHTKC